MLKKALVIAVLVLGGAAVFGTSCGSNTTCPEGGRHCACKAGNVCNSGLMCDDGVCISMTIPPGMGGMTGTGGAGTGTGGSNPQQGGKGGTGTNPGQGGQSANVCMDMPGDNECVMCADHMCCTELTGCGNLPACVSLFNCLGKCDAADTACEDACAAKYPTGIAPINMLFRCIGDNGPCGVPCGGPPETDGGVHDGGGAGGSTPPAGDGGTNVCTNTPNTNECGICVHNKCCSSFTACANNPACGSFGDCVDKCTIGDTACESACTTKFPAGVPLLDALNMCGDANCKAACPAM
jgi:hypothetical protein